MELKKENIHRMGGNVTSAGVCQTNSFTLDDDFNVMEYFCGGKPMGIEDFYVW